MTFDEVFEQIRELLASKGRVTYRALKVRLNLTDEFLAACTEELIEAERVAVDEGGKVLVWVGEQRVVSAQVSVASSQPPISGPRIPNPELPPVTYTPPHLAE